MVNPENHRQPDFIKTPSCGKSVEEMQQADQKLGRALVVLVPLVATGCLGAACWLSQYADEVAKLIRTR